MFVVDFITAGVLAFVLTIVFAAVVRGCGYRSVRDLPVRIWVMSTLAWSAGILLVAFGQTITGTHWVAFAVSCLLVAAVAVAFWNVPKFRRSLHSRAGERGLDAQPAIAWYFVLTLLLFFCAVSVRFYIVNLT